MRPLYFLGNSLKCLRDFPEDARHDAGYQLDKVQRGDQPDDFKPMPAIGKGVEEIRVSDSSGALERFSELGCLTVLGQTDHGCRKLGTDMNFRRRLPEIRCLSLSVPGLPREDMPRARPVT